MGALPMGFCTSFFISGRSAIESLMIIIGREVIYVFTDPHTGYPLKKMDAPSGSHVIAF